MRRTGPKGSFKKILKRIALVLAFFFRVERSVARSEFLGLS